MKNSAQRSSALSRALRAACGVVLALGLVPAGAWTAGFVGGVAS